MSSIPHVWKKASLRVQPENADARYDRCCQCRRQYRQYTRCTGSGSDTRTVSSDVENRLDNLLDNLRVLDIQRSGEVVTNRKYTAQPDGPSLSSLQIDTWSGSNHTFCFVANSKDDMDSRLAAVTSYDAP